MSNECETSPPLLGIISHNKGISPPVGRRNDGNLNFYVFFNLRSLRNLRVIVFSSDLPGNYRMKQFDVATIAVSFTFEN